jgi:hypothetical protein
MCGVLFTLRGGAGGRVHWGVERDQYTGVHTPVQAPFADGMACQVQ